MTKVTIYIAFVAGGILSAGEIILIRSFSLLRDARSQLRSGCLPIKFLSRIKTAALGTKMLCLFRNFSHFLQAFFNFSVLNLAQKRYIKKKTVEIVREN